MTYDFDKPYWETHWAAVHGAAQTPASPANPYLERETESLQPGTVLDAGCGAGAEAIHLARRGWDVTGVDISSRALGHAARSADQAGVAERTRWVEADATVWSPDVEFDLVMTHYAHPASAQLDFYERIASWVKPGGSLPIVGHLHGAHNHAPEHPPEEASTHTAAISARLNPGQWRVLTAREESRRGRNPAGEEVTLHDVVLMARRRP
ncbi:SAM-dependent methyltransferase [Nesterenkonia haasae]|uniref:SAM-dependent methyltransferase n=1 Tax=Nesterenkonia haasae TaxID=2587813 RepID=UPI001391CD44|nr:class I SAM-dependent methyltransferase [Nesterenkonia haasae]NDK31522.1 class I SAM-dependent methyltransferase [Nesterenkonia haasae]